MTRVPILLILLVGESVCFAQQQSAQTADGHKATASFSFSLGMRRDRAVDQTVEMMNERTEAQRLVDLKNANEDVFTRAVDLLRFVPFKLSSSDIKLDDFFTPNYLRADYNTARPEVHLFDKP